MKKLSFVDSASERGAKRVDIPLAMNEDRMIQAYNGVYAVIDGATSMIKADMDGLTPAAYVAQFVVTWLYENTRDIAPNTTAKELLIAVNNAFRDHVSEKFPDIAAQGKYGPSAAGVIVRLHSFGSYSYAQVADCYLVERRRMDYYGVDQPDMYELLTPSQLQGLDDGTLKKAHEKIAKGYPVEEILKEPTVAKKLKANRLFNNVRFGVINGERAMENHINAGTRCLSDVKSLILMSDGMEDIAADPGFCKVETAAEQMVKYGVRTYWKQLRAVFDTDPNFTRWTRFKHMDDATGMVISFEDDQLDW